MDKAPKALKPSKNCLGGFQSVGIGGKLASNDGDTVHACVGRLWSLGIGGKLASNDGDTAHTLLSSILHS